MLYKQNEITEYFYQIILKKGVRYFSFPRYWMNQFKQTDAGNLF